MLTAPALNSLGSILDEVGFRASFIEHCRVSASVLDGSMAALLFDDMAIWHASRLCQERWWALTTLYVAFTDPVDREAWKKVCLESAQMLEENQHRAVEEHADADVRGLDAEQLRRLETTHAEQLRRLAQPLCDHCRQELDEHGIVRCRYCETVVPPDDVLYG